MATNPATPTPAYKRVQAPTESLDGIACLAMISGKSIAEILKVAIEMFKLRPTNGPYYITENRLQTLGVKFGFVLKNFREVASVDDLPDLALAWQLTDPEFEGGRYLLFHRMKDFANPKQNYAYVIDPMPVADPSLAIRTDIENLSLTWCMPVSPMGKPPAK